MENELLNDLIASFKNVERVMFPLGGTDYNAVAKRLIELTLAGAAPTVAEIPANCKDIIGYIMLLSGYLLAIAGVAERLSAGKTYDEILSSLDTDIPTSAVLMPNMP